MVLKLLKGDPPEPSTSSLIKSESASKELTVYFEQQQR
jgi:hypothetical protein